MKKAGEGEEVEEGKGKHAEEKEGRRAAGPPPYHS